MLSRRCSHVEAQVPRGDGRVVASLREANCVSP